MLDVLLLHWRVVRNVRSKYSCRMLKKIVQAAAPVRAVARGKAPFATLRVVIPKFEYHLPLCWQSEMMAAQGLDIDCSTLAGWVGRAAALDPIISCIHEKVLKGDNIHADDTPVPVLALGRGRTASRATRPRQRHGIASRPTAPVHIRKPISPDFEASSKQTPMPVTTGSIEAALPKSHNGGQSRGPT
jgi:transposase